MQQSNPSHVWSERCITLRHRITIRVGNRRGSMISRTTNHIDVRTCQPLKTGWCNSSISCGPSLQPPKRWSLFSFIHLKYIWCNKAELRLQPLWPNRSVCIFMSKWLNLFKTLHPQWWSEYNRIYLVRLLWNFRKCLKCLSDFSKWWAPISSILVAVAGFINVQG